METRYPSPSQTTPLNTRDAGTGFPGTATPKPSPGNTTVNTSPPQQPVFQDRWEPPSAHAVTPVMTTDANTLRQQQLQRLQRLGFWDGHNVPGVGPTIDQSVQAFAEAMQEPGRGFEFLTPPPMGEADLLQVVERLARAPESQLASAFTDLRGAMNEREFNQLAARWRGRPLIRPGNSSSTPGIRLLQQRLLALGYRCPQDGILGPETARQVAALQRDHHVDEQGQVGFRTWAVLESVEPLDLAALPRYYTGERHQQQALVWLQRLAETKVVAAPLLSQLSKVVASVSNDRTTARRAPGYRPVMETVFGASAFELVQHHNQLLDVDIPARMREAGLDPTRDPVVLINADAHSDASIPHTPRDWESIGTWVNTAIAQNPTVEHFYWVTPDVYRTDPRLARAFYGNVTNNQWSLADGPSRRVAYVTRDGSNRVFWEHPPDDPTVDVRQVQFTRCTLAELPNMAGKNTILTTDLDYFGNTGLDTYQQARVSFNGDASFLAYAAGLQNKQVRPFLHVVSISSHYVRSYDQAALLGFAHEARRASRTKMDDNISNHHNQENPNATARQDGITVPRHTPEHQLLDDLTHADLAMVKPDFRVNITPGTDEYRLALAAAKARYGVDTVTAAQVLQELDARDGAADNVILPWLLEQQMADASVQRLPAELLEPFLQIVFGSPTPAGGLHEMFDLDRDGYAELTVKTTYAGRVEISRDLPNGPLEVSILPGGRVSSANAGDITLDLQAVEAAVVGLTAALARLGRAF